MENVSKCDFSLSCFFKKTDVSIYSQVTTTGQDRVKAGRAEKTPPKKKQFKLRRREEAENWRKESRF
jgi:hypothetical protein